MLESAHGSGATHTPVEEGEVLPKHVHWLEMGSRVGSAPVRSHAVHVVVTERHVRQLSAHGSHAPSSPARVNLGQVERQPPKYRMGRSTAHVVHWSAAEHSSHSAAHSWHSLLTST